MATLAHFHSFFSSFSPHKLSSFHRQSQLLCVEHPPRKHFTICASSNRKPRASRKLMSDAELCNSIREFVSATGFPDGHVPSMKELSQHGRKDLANIVRRRGYKVIKELLASSSETEIDESAIEGDLIGKQDAASDCKDSETVKCQDEKVDNLDEHVSLSTEAPTMDMKSDEQLCMYRQSSTDSYLQQKVANFIQNGELDTFEVGIESKTLLEEIPENVPSGVAPLNGSVLTSEQIVPLSAGNNLLSDNFLATEGLINADSGKDLDSETSKREKQVEIDHLKVMLHQKELELSQLKEQIEKEKLALSVLQSKAESEISKAQKLILERDAELHAAEESLSGVEEVEVLYSGDGESVEVAGSFNGWHHQIKMDPQPPSGIIDTIGPRKSRQWSAVLWLYPGVYEIKFVVDGQWKIDHQRESVTRGTIHNNILRVGR